MARPLAKRLIKKLPSAPGNEVITAEEEEEESVCVCVRAKGVNEGEQAVPGERSSTV